MKRKKTKRFNLLKFIVFILIIYLLYYLLSYAFTIKLKNIIIVGNDYYTDEQIIETAKIDNYPRFLLLRKESIIKKIKTLDLIDSVSVKKEFPFVLRITISEKKILYYNSEKNAYMCSDNVYRKLDNVISPSLINYIPNALEEEFVNGLSNINIDIIKRISQIEYAPSSYDNERFLLYMNDNNNVYINIDKIETLNKYIEILNTINNKTGILYLDSGNYFEVMSD